MTDHVELADIADITGCRAVVDLQIEVWGRDSETVPASVLMASVRRGGVLIGARAEDAAGRPLCGFVWSMPGWRDVRTTPGMDSRNPFPESSGQPTHWSHMLAVAPGARGDRLGERLKRAQRERVLARGLDLIEWTFDPLQAQNAHLNMSVLGSIATTYLIDAYGEMRGTLHLGTPTDRLIAEWWIRKPHVERRLALRTGTSRRPLTARSAAVVDAPAAIIARTSGPWLEPAGVDTSLEARRILIPIPPRFGDMQKDARELALGWRHASRTAFTTYLSRAYRVVDFLRNRAEGGGAYLLSRDPE